MKLKYRLLLLLCCTGIMMLAGSVLASMSVAMTPTIDDAKNAVYHDIYEKDDVRLVQGKWQGEPFVKNGTSRPMAGLIEDFTFTGDINSDGRKERVVFLWESSGGSGTLVYLAVLASHDGKIVNLATELVGDRVQLQRGYVEHEKIQLNVIEATESDPACCPTHKMLRSWSLKDKQLIESEPQSLGVISLTDLEGVEWVLTQLKRQYTLPENITVTMTVKGDRIGGRSGCNRYFAAIKSGENAGDIAISQAGATRMACRGEAMNIESDYLKALSSVNGYSFMNGNLVLIWKDEDGTTQNMIFQLVN